MQDLKTWSSFQNRQRYRQRIRKRPRRSLIHKAWFLWPVGQCAYPHPHPHSHSCLHVVSAKLAPKVTLISNNRRSLPAGFAPRPLSHSSFLQTSFASMNRGGGGSSDDPCCARAACLYDHDPGRKAGSSRESKFQVFASRLKWDR